MFSPRHICGVYKQNLKLSLKVQALNEDKPLHGGPEAAGAQTWRCWGMSFSQRTLVLKVKGLPLALTS